MNDLNELKELWQKQPVGKITSMDFKDKLPGILEKLTKFEKKQFRINIFKTTVVIILVFLMGFTLGHMNPEFFSITGIVLMMSSVIWFMFVYWKKQFRVSELNLNDTSSAFLDFAIFRLSEQKKLFKVHFQFFGLALMLGLNLLYFDVYRDYPTDIRLTMHIGMTLFLFLAMFLGRSIRMRRIKNEWQPLIDELTEMKKDLNEEDKNEMLH